MTVKYTAADAYGLCLAGVAIGYSVSYTTLHTANSMDC